MISAEKPPEAMVGTSKPQRAAFRPDIEGLRAIAILLVVGYHTAVPGFSGGYVGVDIFFVLSGYLITGLLVAEIDQTGTVDFPRFYARRARRLLPALTLTLLITIIAGVAIYPPSEVVHSGLATTAISTAAYASNLYFARSGDDYFAPDREENPLLHTWSLSVEEQFYLIWPLFIIFALTIFASRNRLKVDRRRLMWWMATAVVFSFALSLYWTGRRQSWAYFTSPARAWEFALGGLAALLPQVGALSGIPRSGFLNRRTTSLQTLARKAEAYSGWAGLVGIGVAAVVFSKKTIFPGFAVLLPALSTILVLRAGTTRATSSLMRILRVRPLQEVGRLSYSWYLWHWPVVVAGSALVSAPSLGRRACFAALSLGLSAASYRLVENPIRNARKLAGSNRYSLAMAGVVAILGISASFVWRETSIRKAGEPAQLRFNLANNDFAASVLNDKCMANISDVDVKTCTFGANSSSPPIVLFGDSHAAQWFPALEPIAIKRRLRLVTIMKLGCPAVDAPFFDPELGRIFSECSEWRKMAIQTIYQIRPVLTVVSSRERDSIPDAESRNGIESILKSLAASSQNVLMLRDTPGVDFDVPSCLARSLWRPSFLSSSSCQFSFPPTSKVYESQLSAASQYKNVLTVDMSPNICPHGTCTGRRNDLIIYRDSHHLTASFVKTLESAFDVQIDRALGLNSNSHPDLARVYSAQSNDVATHLGTLEQSRR